MKQLAKVLGVAVVCGGLLGHHPAKADFYFTDNDRLVLKQVVVEPSGTDNVVFYAPGTVIPETVQYAPLPETVTTRLTPAPEGDVYVSYGGNVYLIDHDRRIVDAVELY